MLVIRPNARFFSSPAGAGYAKETRDDGGRRMGFSRWVGAEKTWFPLRVGDIWVWGRVTFICGPIGWRIHEIIYKYTDVYSIYISE